MEATSRQHARTLRLDLDQARILKPANAWRAEVSSVKRLERTANSVALYPPNCPVIVHIVPPTCAGRGDGHYQVGVR